MTEGSRKFDETLRATSKRALKTLLLSILFLTAAGWVMLLDAGAIYKGVYNPAYFSSLVDTRLIAMFSGLVLIGIAWLIPPAVIRKLTWPVIILAVLFLILIFTPLGVIERGSRRWLNLGFTFQPIEFVKLALVWFLADRFARIGQLSKAGMKQFILPGIFVIGLVALVGAQPNLSGVFFLIVITLAMVILGGINWKPVMVIIGGAAVTFAGLLALNSDRMSRFVAYDPLSNLSDTGYQLSQSLWAVTNGGLFGRGPGESIAMYSLPDHTTDFVFSILSEEWGFAGGTLVILLFVLVVYSGFRIALTQNDPFRLLLGCGIASIIGIQAAVNIGVVLGLLPTTGVPLPFISAGGSNLILSLGAIGLLMNLSRTAGEHYQVKAAPKTSNGKILRYTKSNRTRNKISNRSSRKTQKSRNSLAERKRRRIRRTGT